MNPYDTQYVAVSCKIELEYGFCKELSDEVSIEVLQKELEGSLRQYIKEKHPEYTKPLKIKYYVPKVD